MGKRDPEREQRWRRTIEEWTRSGQTAKQFCGERELSVNALYSWRRELRRRDDQSKRSRTRRTAPDRFVQLRLEPDSAWIEIELAGVTTMRMPTSLDEQTMTKVMVAARKAMAC